MIVDLETRVWNRTEELGDELAFSVRRGSAGRWLAPDAGPDALASAASTVDASVLIGFESRLLRGAIAERVVLDAAARLPGRIFAARAIDPLGADGAARVESARRDGFAALWMDPSLQGFHPTDTRAMRVFDRAEAAQLPVLLGWSGPMAPLARLEFARPYLLDEVARAFPRLVLVISGFGAPFASETIAMLAKHDRVYATTAGLAFRPWELLQTLQLCRDHGVEERVLFASGFPFDTPARAIEAVYSVNSMVAASSLPAIPRSVLRGIIERDSISQLGLGVAPAPGDRSTVRTLASTEPLRLHGEKP
jgi:uncharacterized protein